MERGLLIRPFVSARRADHRSALLYPNCKKSIPHPITMPHTKPMNPLASFTFLITTAQSLVAAVTTRDNLHIRPALARQAVAARLRSGMIVLRAFLRRLIILIALELEWSLVDTRGAMKRPHGRRKSKPSSPGCSLQGLNTQGASPWLNASGPNFKPVVKSDSSRGYNTPVNIDMANLYAQLDYLAGLAANPLAKAKRLAFHIARNYEGIIIARDGPKRIAGRWGTEVSASYTAIAGSIIMQSRNRPPPLPPPRTHWPTITAF
jgi:hypothetical protein